MTKQQPSPFFEYAKLKKIIGSIVQTTLQANQVNENTGILKMF